MKQFKMKQKKYYVIRYIRWKLLGNMLAGEVFIKAGHGSKGKGIIKLPRQSNTNKKLKLQYQRCR